MLASIQHIHAYDSMILFRVMRMDSLGQHHTENFEQETTPKLNNKETASNNPRLQSGQRSFLTSIANLNPKSNLYITYKVHIVVELGLLDSDFNNQLSYEALSSKTVLIYSESPRHRARLFLNERCEGANDCKMVSDSTYQKLVCD